MALNLLVCIGVNHIDDVVDFVEKQIFQYQPRIITLEQALNQCGWLDGHLREFENFEFLRYAQLAEKRSIPYYCVDGNVDPDQWPFFSELGMASSLSFPKDKDKITINAHGTTYNEKKYYDHATANPMYYLFEKKMTPGQKIKEYEGRNQFMAQAINKLVKKRTKARLNQPISCLMHIGGSAHFNLNDFKKFILKFPIGRSIPGPYSLVQDLVSAKKKIIINAVIEEIIAG